jgi:hypothetical protein
MFVFLGYNFGKQFMCKIKNVSDHSIILGYLAGAWAC